MNCPSIALLSGVLCGISVFCAEGRQEPVGEERSAGDNAIRSELLSSAWAAEPSESWRGPAASTPAFDGGSFSLSHWSGDSQLMPSSSESVQSGQVQSSQLQSGQLQSSQQRDALILKNSLQFALNRSESETPGLKQLVLKGGEHR